jgi:hypothetical protein
MPRSRKATSSNRTLAQIAKAIKALEKRGIRDIVAIGKLLHEAEQKCEHGDFMLWIKENFDFSHDTSRNYRSAYQLSQNPNCSDYRTWNVSVRTFYWIAEVMTEGRQCDVGAAKAVIKIAKKQRVSSRHASEIINEYHRRRSGDPELPPASGKTPVALLTFDHVDDVVDDSDSSGTEEQQKWKRSVRAEAEQAIETIEDLYQGYLDFGKSFEAPPDLVSLINQATECWIELRAKVDKSTVSSSVKAKADAAAARSKLRSGGES